MKLTVKFKKISFFELLYDIAIVIYLCLSILDLSVIDISAFFMPLSLAAIGLLIYRLILLKMPSNSIVVIAIIVIVTILAYFFSGRSWFLPYTIIFAVCGYKIDYNHILKIFMLFDAILVLILSLLAINGIISNNLFYRLEVFSGQLAKRQSLGFNNVNTFALIAFQIPIIYILLKDKKISKKDYIVFCASIVIIYLITKNYTVPIAGVFILIFLISIYICNKDLLRKIMRIFICFPLLLFGLSYYLAINYDPTSKVWSSINMLLSGRIELWNNVYTRYGIHFGGRIVEFGYIGSTRYVLDNSYLQLGIRYGIIMALVFILIYTLLVYKMVEEDEYIIVCILIGMSIVGFMETALIILCMNVVLIYLPESIFKLYFLQTNNRG